MSLTFKGDIDFSALHQELLKALGSGDWYLNGAVGEVTFVSQSVYPKLLEPEVVADPSATPPVEGKPAVYGPDPAVLIQAHIDNAKQRHQNAVWEKIKAKRDLLKTKGTKVGNYWFHSDPDSRTQQLGLVILGSSIPANLSWKTMSGEFVTMTPELAQQVFQATVLSDKNIFTIAETHKAAMLQAEDPYAYDYSTGWPETYVA